MNTPTINVKELIKGIKTYPNWTTSRQYPILVEDVDAEKSLVYYTISGPVRRKVKRVFPKNIHLTPRFTWTLGFLKGEGSNSLGKSNYRRFTITNTNPKLLNIVLEELEAQNLFKRNSIIKGGVNILHARKKEGVVKRFWAEQLNLPIEKIRLYDDKAKTSKYGVCHIYISDVLLRRVMDELSSYVMNKE